jgi:hypothetical protein
MARTRTFLQYSRPNRTPRFTSLKEEPHIAHSPFSHSTCSLPQERRGASKQDGAESVPKGRVSPHLGIATRIDSGECFILPGRLFSFSSIVPSRGFATNLKVQLQHIFSLSARATSVSRSALHACPGSRLRLRLREADREIRSSILYCSLRKVVPLSSPLCTRVGYYRPSPLLPRHLPRERTSSFSLQNCLIAP